METPLAQRATRIPTLDGWRAIAISSVIVHHIAAQKAIQAGKTEPLWLTHFAMGVDVFFAISGLLITKLLIDHWKQTASLGLQGFYIRRAFRILPPALVCLATTGVLRAFGSRLDWISCLTFWRNYLPFHLTTIYTDHFWSLSLEEQYYLVWPWMLLLMGIARAPKGLFWTIVALNVWRMFVLLSPGPTVMLRTDVRGDGLLWGCMAAFAYEAYPRFRIPWYAFALSILAAPLLFEAYAGMSVFPIAMAAAVLATVQHPAWPVSSALEWRPLVWIGKRSYGIYLWQQLFIAYGDLRLPFLTSMAVRIVALLVVTELSYALLEKPLQNLGRRLSEGR